MMLISTTTTNLSAQPETLRDAYANLAWQAMLIEVNLSPKPGLVDRNNCGAHKDMALEDFYRSAEAIHTWLPRFIEFGEFSAQLSPEHALHGLRPLGMACEADMYRATAGVNTHKGSIFSLGLLCAAIGRLHQLQQTVTAETICSTAATFCRGLTERELRQNNQQHTAGQRLYQQLGLTGARGEAEAGYPLVIFHALPHYRAMLAQGVAPDLALLDTLLLLISINDDTNVVSRGGVDGLRWIQKQAAVLLLQGGVRTFDDLDYLRKFDRQCIERNLSPGGSADLLIITYFLEHILQVYSLYD
ncbi:triphosphoribosyl-dephospho-CoA synthase [Citrobacter youngae]|nr:triphosphoribosyl-dephospho-CoA synthase [Citrobacter youngae]